MLPNQAASGSDDMEPSRLAQKLCFAVGNPPVRTAST
jgi:hypothetical protein